MLKRRSPVRNAVILAPYLVIAGCGGGGGTQSAGPTVAVTSSTFATASPTPTTSPTSAPTPTVSFTTFQIGQQPIAVAISPSNVAYVVTLGSSIFGYSSMGLMRTYTSSAFISSCATATPDGTLWYNDGSPGGGITRLDPVSGSSTHYSANLGSTGFSFCVAAAADGSVWGAVANNATQGFLRVTQSGTATFVATPEVPQENINAMTRGPDGNVWFSGSNARDSSTPYIGRINADGTRAIFPYPFARGGVNAMVAGSDGNVGFCDTTNAIIGAITPNGAYLQSTAVGNAASFSCNGIAAGKQPGSYWFLNSFAGTLNYWSPNKPLATYPLPNATNGPNPIGLSMDSNGNFWLGEGNKTAIDYVTIR